MQRISVNLTNDCDGNQLNYNNDLPAVGNKNYALQKPFETVFLHSNIFFYVKLFVKIILSWNLLKCILWYLLELSDPFIKNENSVLPILIEKNWIKNLLLSLKNEVFFFKRRKVEFFVLNLDKDYQNHFLNSM